MPLLFCCGFSMSHWQKYHARWSQIQPPLRPDADVVACMQHLAGTSSLPVLLLGVTPELADAFKHVDAVDRNSQMIANVWPGDGETKRAIEANWLDVGLEQDHYAAVIGDGSLNNVAWPEEITNLLARVMDWLQPGGTFACRLFERPARAISRRHLLRIAAEPASTNFHAFKWQLAMHIAEERGANVPVASILQLFEELFPDRDALARTTGWPRQTIDTIDVYRGSQVVYSFPDRNEFKQALPMAAEQVRFVACGTYDLAMCCPVLTFRRPA